MTLLFTVVLGACSSPVSPEYEEAKTTATQTAGPAPARWDPDVVITLSHKMLGELLTEVLAHYGTLEDEFSAVGIASLRPKLTVASVRLGRADCPRCVGVGARLEGTLGLDTVVGGTEAPMAVDAAFDAVIDVVKSDSAWTVQLTPRQLQDLDVEIGGVGISGAKAAVRDWINGNLLADIPAQEITSFASEDLPLRELKVEPRAGAVQLHLLTAVPDPESVRVTGEVPEGWRIDLSSSTLVKMAAAAAHEAGPVEHDIVPVPTALSMVGQRFTLGLRLWRVKGAGWWRDYEVQGAVAVEKNKLRLTPKSAKKVGQSKGAVLADPLSALGQGVILSAIEGALDTTLPATHRERMDGLRTRVVVQKVQGAGTFLTAEGQMVVSRGERAGRPRRAKLERSQP